MQLWTYNGNFEIYRVAESSPPVEVLVDRGGPRRIAVFSTSRPPPYPPPYLSRLSVFRPSPLPYFGRNSPTQTAYEEKKEKVSSMNWGNLGKSGGGGGGGKRRKAGRGQVGPSYSSYGGPAGGEAALEDAAGLDAAWKEAALPKAGDELKCRHFKACAGCEFDRRFDETPIMVDSRQEWFP